MFNIRRRDWLSVNTMKTMGYGEEELCENKKCMKSFHCFLVASVGCFLFPSRVEATGFKGLD